MRDTLIREQCGFSVDVVTNIEKEMMRWFGHIEKMDKARMTKRYRAQMKCRAGRGSSRRKYK